VYKAEAIDRLQNVLSQLLKEENEAIDNHRKTAALEIGYAITDVVEVLNYLKEKS
jgi:hypothetical protein